MMSTVHAVGEGFIQYTKGAPDEVLKRCTTYWDGAKAQPMTDAKRAEILAANKAMADKALRVLAASMRRWTSRPESDEAAFLEQDLCFIGLTGMIDPVRPEVKPAIVECREAGIRPVMITGDHKDTAVAIATELGIIHSPDEAITGSQLDDLSDEELAEAITKYGVYARVQPEHKVRIVTAWKKRGAITAMTGDGVNDAPSIKAADIGVGMGITGTDVTKNVADMVLADDNFATIVNAVSEGRRIYDNIRKAIQFLLASNMSEVLGVFFATLMGFTLLNPVHLLFINLITDCFPALALGMEKAEDNVMHRPPRKSTDGIFAGGLGIDVAYQGVLVTVITPGLLYHRPLHGSRLLRNAPRRLGGRHDHGLPDHEHVRDLPQLQHAQPARQHLQGAWPQQGAVGRHARQPGADHPRAGSALHRQRLRLHPHQPARIPGGAGPVHRRHPGGGDRQAHPAFAGQEQGRGLSAAPLRLIA